VVDAGYKDENCDAKVRFKVHLLNVVVIAVTSIVTGWYDAI
jgi:hypothetical protein